MSLDYPPWEIGEPSLKIVETSILPLVPSPGEQARRIVRHGLADVLEWLGEPVGPSPEPKHCLVYRDTAFVSRELLEAIRAEEYAWPIKWVLGVEDDDA
jgi:hypothetical protein